MLFQKKPLLYFEFLERRIRYLVMDAQSRTVLEKNEILFDTEILHEGRIINPSLLENRLNALVTEKKWKNAQAAILLPDDFVIVREEKIPAQLAPSEIKAYIALHMGQLIRSPFKETRFHFELLEVGDNGADHSSDALSARSHFSIRILIAKSILESSLSGYFFAMPLPDHPATK